MTCQQGNTTHIGISTMKQIREACQNAAFKRNKNKNLLSHSESNWSYDKKVKETKSQHEFAIPLLCNSLNGMPSPPPSYGK